MERAYRLRADDNPAAFLENRALQCEVEDVVVQATILGIATRARGEGIQRACGWIAAQVVKGENLLEMGEIVLGDTVGKVLL